MKTYRVEISTFVLIDAEEGLEAIDWARSHFKEVCSHHCEGPGLAREASYDVSAVMCNSCFRVECSCEKKAVPVIRRDLA